MNLPSARQSIMHRSALRQAQGDTGVAQGDTGVPRAETVCRFERSEAKSRSQRDVSSLNLRWATGVAAALVLAIALSYAPVRGAAQSLLSIFQPEAFTPIALHRADFARLRGMPFPNLQSFGETRVLRREHVVKYANMQSVSRTAHQVILRPHYLPRGIGPQISYFVASPTSATFTFDAKRARGYAARHHATLPPMPPNLAGSTVTGNIGAIVSSIYGKLPYRPRHRRATSNKEMDASPLDADVIMVTQAPAPRFYSDGATLTQIESYLLSMPNVPPDLAAQIRAIGDPATTVPVPIPVDKMNAQQVQVHGANGLLVGDNTGLGAFVLWQQRGEVYAVGGPYAASEVMQVANSLAP